MNRKRIGLFLLVAAVLGGLGVYFWHVRNENSADRFVTAVVERGSIEDTVSAIGALQPLQYVDVGTQVTGQLKSLHVEIGDTVKQGQLVAEIDPTLLQAKVDSTKATLQNLRAQLVDRQAQAKLAQQQVKRNRELMKADAVAEELLQQSEAAAVQGEAQVESLRAQIRQNESSLTADEANLRYTRIFAPMAGTVVSLTARQGQTLVSSQQAPVILRIADLSTMTVWAQASEADVPKIHVAMPVYFNTLGLPERRWNSKVRQILPTPETVNNVILYNVLFDVDNPDGVLKPQMSAQVYFLLARAEDALLIPANALQSSVRGKRPAGNGDATRGARQPEAAGEASVAKAGAGEPATQKKRRFIVRVLKDGQPEEREITVGVLTRLKAQVLSGLEEGETVVTGTVAKDDKTKDSGGRGLRAPGR
ncbi:MAG: efflux RND transporter periplasmic adaptor subunit [Sterolibacteriaceae bacterium]|jgi:macrolide-specific efflux system membrane fusion protein|nr:efflux RND transporter periplasmic adaptor subunit [Sterolibacteriaceae bacterium]MBK9084541.1 efflux RND transporter periplasmic adaptor subunit [Sterolibacteriaceae bacterium]